MPSLTREQRAQLLGPTGQKCECCGFELVKNYCRSCDEFFIVCSKDCVKSAGATVYMFEHRIYLWSPEGVLAIPDLDIVFEGSR
jgi:hypothetical protein